MPDPPARHVPPTPTGSSPRCASGHRLIPASPFSVYLAGKPRLRDRDASGWTSDVDPISAGVTPVESAHLTTNVILAQAGTQHTERAARVPLAMRDARSAAAHLPGHVVAIGRELPVLDGDLSPIGLAVGHGLDPTVRPHHHRVAARLRQTREVYGELEPAAMAGPCLLHLVDIARIAEVALVRYLSRLANDVAQIAVAAARGLTTVERPGANEAPALDRI